MFWNAWNRDARDHVSQAHLVLQAPQVLDTGGRVPQDDAILGKPLDGELTGRPLHDRVRPTEICTLEEIDERGARYCLRPLQALGDEDVAQRRDVTVVGAVAKLQARLSVESDARL